MVGNSEHVSGWGDLGCVFAIQQPSRLMLLAHPSCANKTWKRMDDAKLKFYTGKKDVLLPNLFNSNFFWTIPPLFRHLQIMTQWTSNLHHIMVIFLGKYTILVMVLQNEFCNFSCIISPFTRVEITTKVANTGLQLR